MKKGTDGIGPEGATVLAEALKINETVNTIDLSGMVVVVFSHQGDTFLSIMLVSSLGFFWGAPIHPNVNILFDYSFSNIRYKCVYRPL